MPYSYPSQDPWDDKHPVGGWQLPGGFTLPPLGGPPGGTPSPGVAARLGFQTGAPTFTPSFQSGGNFWRRRQQASMLPGARAASPFFGGNAAQGGIGDWLSGRGATPMPSAPVGTGASPYTPGANPTNNGDPWSWLWWEGKNNGLFDPFGPDRLLTMEQERAQRDAGALQRQAALRADLSGLDPAQAAFAKNQAMRDIYGTQARGLMDARLDVAKSAIDYNRAISEARHGAYAQNTVSDYQKRLGAQQYQRPGGGSLLGGILGMGLGAFTGGLGGELGTRLGKSLF